MTKELNQYYREVRRHLDCPKREKDCLLSQSCQLVEELRESIPDLDYLGVVDFLGEPRELASTLVESMDQGTVAKYKKQKARLRVGAISLFSVFVVTLSAFSFYVAQQKEDVVITGEDVFVITEYVRTNSAMLTEEVSE